MKPYSTKVNLPKKKLMSLNLLSYPLYKNDTVKHSIVFISLIYTVFIYIFLTISNAK
ncbi:hypothetical protein LEQ41_09895 [Streptococcus agalactiae]|nr:hypothetical protein [Streptococcus agalactiae]